MSSLGLTNGECQNFNQIISSLFKSQKYSDLTLKCQDKLWRVHRIIVSAVDGSFKEATTGEFEFKDVDADVVEQSIWFLYHGWYHDGSGYFSAPRNALRDSGPFGTTGLLGGTIPTTTSATSASLFGGLRQQATTGNSFTPTTTSPATGSVPRSRPLLFGNSTAGSATPSNSNSTSSGTVPPTTTAHTSSELFASTSPKSSPPSSKMGYTDSLNIRPEALIKNAKIYVFAEQYDIQPLKYLAKVKYEQLLHATWNSSFFVESLQIIYDGTPDTTKMDMLRKVAVDTAGKNAKELLKRKDFSDLCTDRGDICADILRVSLEVTVGPPRCKVDIYHDVRSSAGGLFSDKIYQCTVCNTILR